MKDLFKFIKTSGVYFVGTVLTKLITFLLLPVYTAYIDPAGMGTYDAVIAVVTFVCSFLYLDVWSTIMRFTYEYEGVEQRKPITSGVAIFLASTGVYTLAVFGAQFFLKVDYIQWIYLYGLLINGQHLCGYLARTQGKNILYATSGIWGSLVQILLNILLIVGLKMDYSALYMSSCGGYLFMILYVAIGIRLPKLIAIRDFSRKLFKQMLYFSLPLCVNSVAYWFLSGYNRVAITWILGNETNGMYAIASRFGSFVTLFTSCFSMAWQEMAYSKEAKGVEDQGQFYTTAINAFIKFLGLGLVALIPFIYVIYPIMINDNYAIGKTMVPLYMLATITSSLSGFLGNIFTAIKKNNQLFFTTVVGSVVNVIMVHLLLPLIGIQGASIALFMGFGINCVIRVVMLKKQLHFTIDVPFLFVIGALFVLSWLAYASGNFWANLGMFLLAVGIMLWVFREPIGNMWNNLKEKKQQRNNKK